MAYEYCLTCDSAMSRRFVYAGGTTSTQGEILQGQRFVYDGLTLLRVDQLYDSDEDEELEMTDDWRVWWENTTMPALLGGLLAKRVYSYPNDQSGTSNGSTDYYYAHDAIGNVVAVSDSNGVRQHHFTQDAFGNELTLDSLGGDDWNAAHVDGIWEHQTGKWFDPETELYFFHARWVDPVVGRFVGRDPVNIAEQGDYVYVNNNPLSYVDPTGRCDGCGPINIPGGPSDEITFPFPPIHPPHPNFGPGFDWDLYLEALRNAAWCVSKCAAEAAIPFDEIHELMTWGMRGYIYAIPDPEHYETGPRRKGKDGCWKKPTRRRVPGFSLKQFFRPVVIVGKTFLKIGDLYGLLNCFATNCLDPDVEVEAQ